MRQKHRVVLLFASLALCLLFTLQAFPASAQLPANFTSAQPVVAPLQPVGVSVRVPGYSGPATLLVFDSAKRLAGSFPLNIAAGSGSVQVMPRGALGPQWAALFIDGAQVAAGDLYRLDASTIVLTGVEEWDQLYWRVRDFMLQKVLSYELDGQTVRGYRSPDSPLLWLRDHVYQGRGFRYFDPEVKLMLEAFRRTQAPDGSFPDFLARPQWGIPAFRTPVEADVEYLFVQGVYDAWQMSGDDAWMRTMLPAAQKAISYTLNSPLRWEASLGLIKRPFTIDTWDFEYGPTTRDPNSGQPAPRHWIDEQTKWGIFHGDNTGLAQALRALARMEQQFGLWDQAWTRIDLASQIMARLNKLSWNGRFYTHHVKLVPFDVPGVDEAEQLSLSNAIALNRGVLTVEQGRAIVKEYNDRISRPDNTAFAEWWSIDPPFPPGAYGLNNRLGERPGEYVNGGIMPLVGGELARGAFRYGYEDYGFDILHRYYDLIKHSGSSYLWYYPTGGFAPANEFLPTDGWGSSAMLGALMEGAAGIEDQDVRYGAVNLSPRWPAAPAAPPVAYVVARYAASDGYVAYRWEYRPASDGSPSALVLEATGSGARFALRLLLPPTSGEVSRVTLNGQPVPVQIETVGLSRYVLVNANGPIVQVQITL